MDATELKTLKEKIAEIDAVEVVSVDEQEGIRRNTAYALPDSPVSHGMNAARVKSAFWRGIVGEKAEDEYNVVFYLNRLATTLNTDIETLCYVLRELEKADAALGKRLDDVPDATTSARGYMTPEQVNALKALTDIFEDVDDSNTTVDTIRDVLAAFDEFAEGTNVAKLFADLQKSDASHDADIAALEVKSGSETADRKAADIQLMQAHRTLATRLGLTEKKIAILNGLTDFVVDDTVAYQKIVPPAALPYATIDKIGGVLGEVWSTNVFAKYGELVFDNYTPLIRDDSDPSKATIYIRGSSDGSYFYGNIATLDLPLGKKFTLSVNHNVGSSFVQLGWDDEAKEENGIYNIKTNGDNGLVMVYFNINSLSSVNGTLTITLNEGDVALSHEPSVADSAFAPVTEVVSESANLFDIDNPIIVGIGSTDTIIKNSPIIENGTIYSGGKTGNSIGAGIFIDTNGIDEIYVSFDFLFNGAENPAQYFTVDFIDTVDENNVYTSTKSFNIPHQNENGYVSQKLNVSEYPAIALTFYATKQYGIAITNLMVSTENVPYQPYGVLDTFPIPAEVQALQGYGEANPENASESNYIDLEMRKFVAYGYMSDGVWVAYAELQETNISEHLPADNFIKVGGAGTLTFVNEYGSAVPSTVTYQQEVTE